MSTTLRERPGRRRSRVVFGRLSPLLLILVVGCDLPGQPKPANRPVPADQVLDFTALYAENCAGCHGAGGTLGPAPPLADPLFLAIVPNEEIHRVIAGGRPGTPMPAFARGSGGPLTDAQVLVLARGLKERWGQDASAPDGAPAYAAREATGDVGRGAEVFSRACAGCHGADGAGKDGGAGAVHDRAFLALVSDQALRRYVITGRPDLGMPDYATKGARPADFRPLTSSDVDDLIALLASWRRDDPDDRP